MLASLGLVNCSLFPVSSEFNTEKKLAAALTAPSQETFLKKLFTLITNVCLIYVGDESFVPRIDMEKTSSFYELDGKLQVLAGWRHTRSALVSW